MIKFLSILLVLFKSSLVITNDIDCLNISTSICDFLIESNYFDYTCLTEYDTLGGLGCYAGGIKCCRFCGFGPFINIPCNSTLPILPPIMLISPSPIQPPVPPPSQSPSPYPIPPPSSSPIPPPVHPLSPYPIPPPIPYPIPPPSPYPIPPPSSSPYLPSPSLPPSPSPQVPPSSSPYLPSPYLPSPSQPSPTIPASNLPNVSPNRDPSKSPDIVLIKVSPPSPQQTKLNNIDTLSDTLGLTTSSDNTLDFSDNIFIIIASSIIFFIITCIIILIIMCNKKNNKRRNVKMLIQRKNGSYKEDKNKLIPYTYEI